MMFHQSDDVHCQAGPEDTGPASGPDCATEGKADANKFVYRILRRGESPWTLRQPCDMAALGFKEKRALMVMALGMGNSSGHTSPFLHTSSSLRKCLVVFRERNGLYSNWLVRWPKEIPGVECINFAEHVADRMTWLSADDGDSDLIEECIRRARAYVVKDLEIVYLQLPGQRNVEWWDTEAMKWRTSKEVPTCFKLSVQATDCGDKPAETPRAASVDKVVLGPIY